MISRCYLEITNICNLNCLFCPKRFCLCTAAIVLSGCFAHICVKRKSPYPLHPIQKWGGLFHITRYDAIVFRD